MTRLLLCIACGIHVILTVQCTEHTPDGPNRTSSASSISNSVGTMDHYVVSANNIHQEFTAPRNERENYTNTQKTNDNHEVFARQSNDQQEGDLDTKNELKKNKSHDQAISNRGIDAGFVLQGKSKPVNDGTRLNSLENIQKNSVEKLNELENKTRNENTNNRTIGIYKDIVTNASYRNSMASDEIKYFRKGKDVFSNVTKLPNNEGSMIDNFRKHLDGVRKLTTEEINSTKDLHLDTSFSKESTEISTNITYLQFTFDNSVHTNLVENIRVQSNSSHTTKNSNFQGETAQEKNLEHDVDDSKLKNNTNITNTLNNFIENITEAISTKESFRNVVENISKLANNSLTINQTDLIVGQAKKQYIDLDLKRFSYDNQKIGLLYPEEILYKQNETVQNFTSSRTINPKTTSTFYHKLHSSQNLENQSSPQKNKLTNIFLKHIANLTNRNNSTNITSEQFKQARNARPRKTFNALSTPKFPRKPERSARENSSELSEITEALFKNIPGKTLNQNTTELTLNPKQKLEAPGQYELPQRDAYLKEESLDDVSTGLLIKRLKPGVIKRNHLSPAPVYQTGDVEAVHGYRQPAAVRNISAEKTTTSKDHLPEDERPIQLEAIDLDEDKQISGTSTGSSQTTVTAHALTADKSMSALNHDELSLSPVGAGSIAVTIPNNTTRHSSTLGQLEIDDFPLKNIMTIPQNDRNETNSQNFAMGKIKEICVNCNRNSSGSNTRILMNITKHLATIFEYENYTLPLLPEIIQRIETTPRNMLATSFDFDLFNSTLEYGNDTYANDTLKIIQEFPWPVKREAVVEGDIVLGGLMMVHEREERITCGPVMPQGGIQALEAMLFTLDKVNESNLLPNITIGAHILDDCDKDTYGLEMAVDFIKGSISNIDGAEYHCNKTQVRKVISGVVGAASSVTSIQVANLLRLFKIPQVSFFSTSPELSNKQRFEFFTRTIPSDRYQVKAMVDIVRQMGWSYISIIYEESNYGIKAFEELEDLLAEHNICIAVKEKLVKDSGVADESAYDNIVQKLLTKPRARGAIIFGSDQEVAGVMRAVRRSNATGSFSWIGSDGWSARSLVSDGNEAEVEGTLSVQPKANPVQGFEEYFLSLNVENNERNPWFVEFWEHHFQCRYPNSSRTPYNQKHAKQCTGREKLTQLNTVFEDQLQFVSDAVMAFAYAIRDMHRDLCHGKPGVCDAMKPTKGTELLKYLRNVTFEGLSGDQFRFDGNGDGPARYNIIHFKQVSNGTYRWIRVGEYLEGFLRLNMSEVQFKLGHPKPPESVCSLPCDLGQAKKYVEGESCCWHCFNCTQYQIRHQSDETQCVACPQGAVPDALHVRCVDIPEEYLRPDSGWAIGAMAFSSTGILITMFVAGVFIKHNDTPVVRASGRELSYVLLAGVFMCYSVTFALVLRPNDVVCGVQRFAAGFCFTVVYAALLTKTNRISRIFNAGKRSAKRPSFISPRSQLIICTGFVGFQVLINAVWMIISPATAIHHYPTRDDNLLVCSSYIDASYMIAFTYPIFLIVVCTIYAVLTRKIPEAFNESKHIGFAMYTTCVIWLAFVPLYFGTANNVALRITSMSVTISLSATVTLVCLFAPKLYIILIRPERNVRQSMMPLRYSAISKTTGTAGSGSMMATVMVTAATCNQKQQIQKHVPPVEANDRKNDDKPKLDTKEFGTQTLQIPSNNHAIYNSQEHLQKLNNNFNVGNGPLAIQPSVQVKDIQL